MEETPGAFCSIMTNLTENVLNRGDRILVLAPHPDDETLGCGGTIALYAGMGKEVCAAIISKGEAVNVKAEDIADLRRKEAYRAAEILQIRQVVFMDFPDTALNAWYDEVKQGIRGLIQTFKPDIVFAPSPMDLHEDHVVVSRIAMSLLKELGSFKVAFYEIYSPIRYNCIVDITGVIDIKKKAAMCYHYSLLEKPENIVFAMEGLNAYRSFDFLRKGFFEAFYVIASTHSDDTIIEWLTHGLSKEAAACKYLSEFKKIETLLAEYRNCLDKVKELQQAVEQENSIEKQVESKWYIGEYLRRIKDFLLADNTRRRRLYDGVMRKKKSDNKNL
jgi:N-acetylglucosamine malate deacetylase 1